MLSSERLKQEYKLQRGIGFDDIGHLAGQVLYLYKAIIRIKGHTLYAASSSEVEVAVGGMDACISKPSVQFMYIHAPLKYPKHTNRRFAIYVIVTVIFAI